MFKPIRVFGVLLLLFMAYSCSEKIDESSRYVFKYETILSYLQKHDAYHDYAELLNKVNIGKYSSSKVGQLMSARGNYTVFAPTNKAIQDYLETLVDEGLISEPSWDAFTDSVKLDSIRKVIVFNSIIDGGDETNNYYYVHDFPEVNQGEFILGNLFDRKLSVYRFAEDPDSLCINGDCPVSRLQRDILCTNGIIHQVGKVIAPKDVTAASYIQECLDERRDGYLTIFRVIQACGLLDTLRAIRDEVYEELYQQGKIEDLHNMTGIGFAEGSVASAPKHRLYGFTIFAETDDFWRSEGIEPTDPDLLDKLTKWILDNHQYSDEDKFTTGTDYTSEGHLLYQWVTYHMLPMRISSNMLVIHHNESRFKLSNPAKLGMASEELYTTMGKRRLIKIYESEESQGVYLNRFPVLDCGRNGSGGELSCAEDKRGLRVGADQKEAVLSDIINCCIYPLDGPLAYTDQVRDNLHKQRLRIDAMGMLPEAMTNGIRKRASEDQRYQQVYIPKHTIYQYFNDMWMNEDCNMVYFNAYRYGWPGKNGDEMKAVGRYEVTYRLPPVPRQGIYELRYAIIATDRRGVAQVYFGSDFDKLPVAGIPMDWTIPPQNPITAWEKDTEDKDYNAEIDKRMRNNGYMNGDKSNCVLGDPNNSLREYTWAMRRILLRQYMDPEKTYYIRMKSVLDTDAKEFYMDYIELCPKEVFDNPETPEDIW